MGRVEYWNDPAAPKPNSLVPACGVLAADDAGGVLLRRRRDTGQWAIPMGKQELGETPSQCAIRETLEETGVLTELTGILGVYSDPGHIVAYSGGEIRQEWELIFLGRPVGGTPTVNDEASDVRWVAPGDLEALDIHPTQWRQLRDWLAQSWPMSTNPGSCRTRQAPPGFSARRGRRLRADGQMPGSTIAHQISARSRPLGDIALC
jgi:8-oxo-dGTP pyrophosphatase MutT (NUDIX family)